MDHPYPFLNPPLSLPMIHHMMLGFEISQKIYLNLLHNNNNSIYTIILISIGDNHYIELMKEKKNEVEVLLTFLAKRGE